MYIFSLTAADEITFIIIISAFLHFFDRLSMADGRFPTLGTLRTAPLTLHSQGFLSFTDLAQPWLQTVLYYVTIYTFIPSIFIT